MTDTLRDPHPTAIAGGPKVPPAADAEDSSGPHTASGFLSLAAGTACAAGFAFILLMATMLDTSDYTQFAAAAMLLAVAGMAAAAFAVPLPHYVAAYPVGSEGRRDGMMFSLFVALFAGLAAALVAGGVVLTFATPALALAVSLGSMTIFLLAVPSGWMRGERRLAWAAASTVGMVLLRLAASLTAVALAWGALGATWGMVLGALALLVVPWSFYADLRWRPGVLRQHWRWAEIRETAAVFAVVAVLAGLDVVLVAVLGGGSAEAAGFQVLATLAKGPVFIAAGTALVALPLLRRSGADVPLVLRTIIAPMGQLAVVALAIMATAPIAMAGLVLPGKYQGSLDLLPWIATAGFGYAALPVLATILLATRAGLRCQVGLALAGILVVAGVSAGWHMGAVPGLAIGSAVGAVLATAVLALISGPALSAAGTGHGAGRWMAGMSVLLVLLALAAQLQPMVWLVLAAASGIAAIAYRSGVLAGAFGLVVPPVRSLGLSLPGGRRSKPRVALGRRLAPVPKLVLSSTAAAFTAVVAGAFAVRAFGLERGFELWVDEMLYVRLGESVSLGQIPTLPDGPFFLHPPGFFMLEAGAIRLFGVSGDIVDLVLQLRWLNAVLGAITVGLSFLLVKKLAGKTAAWLAAVVLAFEPFILRNNSHTFLETAAMAAVVAGFLVLAGTREPQAKLPAALRLIGVGLLFGCAVLCKDFFVICTVGPLLAAVVWKKSLHWRKAAVVLVAAAVPYMTYLVVVATQGRFSAWVEAKSDGVLRMTGIEKSTGFTAEGSPSIVERLIEQSGHFGSSYLLLAVCPVAGALLCFSRRADRRLIGLAGLALGLAGAYSAAFGTFEEQYGYGVMVAGVLCSVLVVVELRERFVKGGTLLAVVSVCFVVLTVTLGLRTALTVDNGFVQAKQWAEANLPADARVSVTNSTAEFAFEADPRFGVWPSAPLMQEAGANYILTQSRPTRQGYGYASPDMLAWLEVHAIPVFSAAGPTNGQTTLWFVTPAELRAGAADGIGFPSKDYETGR